MREFFEQYRTDLQQTLNAIDSKAVEAVYQEIELARQNGNHIFVLGNGGSAAAASHWVCDFGKGINVGASKRLKIFAPADSLSLITALGNDVSYNDTFSESLKTYLQAGDLVISLSVSGNSANLIKAHQFATQQGARTVAIIGDYEGALRTCSDLTMVIPSQNYGIVEDIHMSIDHAISQYIRSRNQIEQASGGETEAC